MRCAKDWDDLFIVSEKRESRENLPRVIEWREMIAATN
jgi:hypothetical protein